MKKIVVFTLITLLLLSLPAFAAFERMQPNQIFVSNHCLTDPAKNIYINSFTGVGTARFTSYDSFVFGKGDYDVFSRIVHIQSNTIATSSKVVRIKTNDQSAEDSITTSWEVSFPFPGLYEYQIVANNNIIAKFRFYLYEK